jgi:hypothetical protein
MTTSVKKSFRGVPMTAQIPVVGSSRPALIDQDNYDFISKWLWLAVQGRNGTHAAAIIAGHPVLMEEVVMWAALAQGDVLDRDGGLMGHRPQKMTPAELRQGLEAVLQKRPMAIELNDMIRRASK